MIEKEIDKLLKAGKTEEAVKMLEACPEVNQNEALLLKWGELYYRDGKNTEALNKFNSVLRLNPQNSTAAAYVTMILEVLNFYHKDLLNP